VILAGASISFQEGVEITGGDDMRDT